jgi:hypothetical protein
VLNNGKAAKSWRVVDAMLMPNAFRIAVATTNRDLTFFDLSTGHVSNRLTGLTEIVTSMDYHCDPKNLDRGTLIYGDMGGYVSSAHVYHYPLRSTPFLLHTAMSHTARVTDVRMLIVLFVLFVLSVVV